MFSFPYYWRLHVLFVVSTGETGPTVLAHVFGTTLRNARLANAHLAGRVILTHGISHGVPKPGTRVS